MAGYYQDIAPNLDRILKDSALIQSAAGWIEAAVKNLPAQPQWTTKAEGVMADAETRLWHALETLRRAKRAYAKLPIEHV